LAPGAQRRTQARFLLKIIALWLGRESKSATLLDVVDRLGAETFAQLWREAASSVAVAYRRLTSTQGGYGAFHPRWVPYTTMLMPFAALLREVEKRGVDEPAYRKIDRWYWASVLTRRYDSAVDTKSLADVRDMLRWVDGEPGRDWIETLSPNDVNFDGDELRVVRLPRSHVPRCAPRCARLHHGPTGRAARL
jgi:hypothetical protein